MRRPSDPDDLKNKGAKHPLVGREPSYPDRARIDSDVRDYMRPVSTPWIVFDRDSRVDDATRAALASEPPVIIRNEPLTFGAYPAPEPTKPEPTGPEPTSPEATPDASVATHATHAPQAPHATPERDRPTLPVRRPGRGRRVTLNGAGTALLACGVLALVVLHFARPAGSTSTHVAPSAQAPKATEPEPKAAAVAASVAPAPIAESAPAEVAPPRAATPSAEVVGQYSNDPKKRFGRLTLKADPRQHNVWFDGKRMLGSGSRSYMVFCGMHTIAVNEKADTKDVEVPCNGELVVGGK